MPGYTWLLFDADGTLFDYAAAEGQALADTFAAYGLPFQPAHRVLYRQINHRFWLAFEQGQISAADLRHQRFAQLLTELELQADPRAMAETYLERLAQGTQLVAGAEALLQALHGRYRLLLITNGLQDVQRPRLSRSGLADYFEELIISDEVGVAKPDPAIFDFTFERIGWPAKEEVLIIGDSLTSDMKGGHDYGIDCCWFNPNGRPPDPQLQLRYEIQRLEQLLPILDER